LEWVGNWGMVRVEVAEVRSVDRFDRVNGRWQKGEVFGMMLKGDAGGFVEFADVVSAVAEDFSDGVRSTEAVCEFGNSVECCIALDLDADHNRVVDTEEGLVAAFVHAFTVIGATFFCEKGEDGGGKRGVRLGEAKESVDRVDRSVDRGGCGGEVDVERELEFAANGSNTADNIGTVNGAAVPGVSGAVGGLDEDFVGGAVVGIDGDDFVEEFEEAFDADSFVVAAGSGVEGKVEHVAKGFEGGSEDAVGINDDKAA
jgi:hypothetical protein